MGALDELLLKFSEDIVVGNEEKRNAKILAAFDKAATEYGVQRGRPVREWLQKEIQQSLMSEMEKVPPTPLDEPSVNHIVDHIAKGHLSNVKELLWAELVYHGYERVRSLKRATGVVLYLYSILAMALAAGPEAETGTLEQVDAKELQGLFSIIISSKQRITCPHCYRVIREWDSNKHNMDVGPAQIQCKQCTNVLPTQFTPWDKKSEKDKIITFLLPALFVLGGVIGIALSRETGCTVGGGLAILVGSIWAFSSWREAKSSLKIPVW